VEGEVVTGDTRPPSADDVSGYPTAIVTKTGATDPSFHLAISATGLLL
jgi:hypothetical protein